MSRGLRNCNPGNIRRSASGVRYVGEVEGRDREFRCFRALEWGYRALFVLLHTYFLRYGLHSIEGFIRRWAPPEENHTENYIRAVAQKTGFSPSQHLSTLSPLEMIPLARAISEVENGVKASPREIERGWELFFEDYGPKE